MTRPLETIILAVGFVALATAARACNDGGCEPPPPPPDPPPVVTVPERNDRDPVLPISKPLPCCILPNGDVEAKAPIWTEASKARTRLICETAIRQQAELRPCTRQGIW